MSIPVTEREQILVSSTSNEDKPKGIVAKGTYWVVFSSYSNLHLKEFGGSYNLKIGVAVPKFHLTNALDSSLNLLSDRFWLWTVDRDDNLDLIEIEPVVGESPIIHDTTRIATGVSNVRADVMDGENVYVYYIDTAGDSFFRLYNDIKSATPLKEVELNWSGTRLSNFDTVSYDDQLRVSYVDVLSPPNIYVEDYSLTIPEIFVHAQIGSTLQVQLEWDEVIGAESYRLERSIDDPGFSSPDVIYNGILTTFVDDIPSYSTDYYYRVKLEVPTLGLESLWSDVELVVVGAPPVPAADFIADVTSGIPDLLVSFSDLSTNLPFAWEWDFGDGSSHSLLQNPSHLYTKAGLFSVSLTATNGAGSGSTTKVDYIDVDMVTDFVASTVSGNAGTPVNFTDLTIGEPTAWDWDFGDGTAHSYVQNPSHTYTKAGVFTVTLTASNTQKSDAEVKTDYISIAMVADFTSNRQTGNVPMAVDFVDQTIGEPATWYWNFGDGFTGANQNPTHTYLSPGIYTVSLEASNVSSSDTEAKVDYIVAYPLTVISDFSTDTQMGVVKFSTSINGIRRVTQGFHVHFTHIAIAGEAFSFLWEFGDGATSTISNPTHEYQAPGMYTVTLTVRDSERVPYTIHKVNYIKVGLAEIGISPREADAVPVGVSMSNRFVAPTGYQVYDWGWDFGDVSLGSGVTGPSHIYQEHGRYNVSLGAKIGST